MVQQVKKLAAQDRWLDSIPSTHSEVRKQAPKAAVRQPHVCHVDTCALARVSASHTLVRTLTLIITKTSTINT